MRLSVARQCSWPANLTKGPGGSGFDELIKSARVELQELARVDLAATGIADTADNAALNIHAFESALERYRKTPDVADLLGDLQKKYNNYIQAAELDLRRLLSSTDINAIDNVLTRCRQSGHALAAGLVGLQRHRMDLCDNMSEKLHATLASSDPMEISTILSASEVYGTDLQNERRVLTERLNKMLRAAESEITEMMQTESAQDTERVLRKYQDYPESLRQSALHDLQVHREELRRQMISRVEKAMSCEDMTVNTDLLHTLQDNYGDDMEPYREMLGARRDKMRDVMVDRMGQALRSDSLILIDRVFRNSMPLVSTAYLCVACNSRTVLFLTIYLRTLALFL